MDSWNREKEAETASKHMKDALGAASGVVGYEEHGGAQNLKTDGLRWRVESGGMWC